MDRTRVSDRCRVGRTLTLAATLACSLVVVCGYFGDIVPFFDTLAHFRAHAAVLLVLCGLALVLARLPLAGLIAVAIAAYASLSVAPYLLPGTKATAAAGRSPYYTLLQMNLRWDAPDPSAAVQLIGRLSPDVVTLQEANGQWPAILDRLADRYPYRFACKGAHAVPDATILSRRPFVLDEPGQCGPQGRFAARRINLGGQPVTIVSQHMRWPWPGGQWHHLSSLQGELLGLEPPTLVAGDFNGTPWGAVARHYAELTNTRIVPHVGATWLVRPLTGSLGPIIGLPLDNVLASPTIQIISVERQEATSSDHLPLFVTFTLPEPVPQIQPTSRVVSGKSLPASTRTELGRAG
ncbi:endonuclease/exonuclease/phosphatase family protein [Aurantimonas sp. VKM B-3413]|uniref:endonuclease/exonuclease/phosphatase family protein n=1 Tax=Aurantimonas sp. VKM B-3413 TaxID=2779401 RepID=UPI001E505619|nr:endonuclease/exonuclease/phosphatase family protein [Aurantimonas sp. VKM B-3413]MCB8836067.1 endonuclease/exonuclease/phosphatase family protein [Aurantimonas sp. VKM B-3413]